jgi:hypothetical protein
MEQPKDCRQCSKCRQRPVRAPGQSYCRGCHAADIRARGYVRLGYKRPMTPGYHARKLVRLRASYARAMGRLKPVPCPCGCRTLLGRLQMHHEDYDKPFDVVFCCATEHRRLDALRRARLESAHGEETARPQTGTAHAEARTG